MKYFTFPLSGMRKEAVGPESLGNPLLRIYAGKYLPYSMANSDDFYAPIGRNGVPLRSAGDNQAMWSAPFEKKIMSNTAWPMGTRRRVLEHYQKNVKPKWTEKLTGGNTAPAGGLSARTALQRRLRPGQIQTDTLQPGGRPTLIPDSSHPSGLLHETWNIR